MKQMFLGVSVLILLLLFGTYSLAQAPIPPKPKLSKLEDIKQTVSGVDGKIPRGKLVKVKISDLPSDLDGILTAIYKWTLIEIDAKNQSKKSDNCQTLTYSDCTDKPTVKKDADFIFSIVCDSKIRYQLLFSVTYILTDKDKKVLSIRNDGITVYDILAEGYVPPGPGPGPDPGPDVPSGDYGFIKLVYVNLSKVAFPEDKVKSACEALANAHSGMSSKIGAGIYKDNTDVNQQTKNIEKFLTDAKEANNSTMTGLKLDPKLLDGTLDAPIKERFMQLWNEGKLRKFEDYQKVWAELSMGFRLYAEQH